MDVTVVLFQMIQLFLILGLGYFLYKIKILDADFNQKLTRLLLNVTLPAVILSSVFSSGTISNPSNLLLVFVLGIIIYLILPFVGFLIAKIIKAPTSQQGLYTFMIVYSNIGFMGIPVMNAIYGPSAILYLSIYNMLFNLCLYTVGAKIMTYGTDQKVEMNLKNLLTPGMVASLVALTFYFIGFKPHDIILKSIDMVGGLTTPLAMMIIGGTLAKIPLKEVFTELRVYPFTIFKQIIIPAIAYLILKMIVKDELILGVTLITIAMPVANTAVLFATQYKADEALAAKNVFITTLLSIITIPLIVALFLA